VTTPEGTGGEGEQPEPSFADVLNNLSLDSGRTRKRRRKAEEAEPPPVPEPVVEVPPEEDEWAEVAPVPLEPADGAYAVRPYAWTRGRTRPVYDLAVETLVSATDHGRDMAALTSVEHRSVADLCREPRSVAEVAALLSLPLGVARVVLGDMADIGLVAVHRTASSAGDVLDIALMERVLSGLRRL